MVPSRSRGSKPPPSVGHPAGDGFRILCLEAGAAEAARIADLLKDAFLPVTVTWVDGRQALENALAPGWTFDLLLVAFTLPERAGEAALAWFRKRFPAAPAIVLAGPMEVGGILECLRMGATDCVPQASLALLAPAVRRALEEARRAEAEREAEHANRRLLGLLRATLEATQEGVLVTDLAGRITTYNRKFMTLCGIPEYVMAPMELDRVLQFLLDQFQDPRTFMEEAQRLLQKPDGEGAAILNLKGGRVLEETARPHLVGTETVGHIYSFRDITGQEQSTGRLRQQASMGQVLLAGAQAGRAVPWATRDKDLVIPDYAAPVLGLAPAELPRTLGDLEALIHPEDQDRFRQALERPTEACFEARVRRDGEGWLSTRWSLGPQPDGGYGGIFVDVTRQEARAAQDAEDFRARWLGTLTASMARALRPSLEGLQDSLARLREAGPQAHLDSALSFLDALAGTVEAMAQAAPGASGPGVLLDLNDLLARLRPWAGTALGPGIQLVLEPRAGLPVLPLNPERMELAVMHLLLNARDALDGSGEIRVRTGLLPGRKGGRLFLEVQDDGPGIPPRVREQMFDPFFTTRPGHRGLGLTVVRSIVASYGGSLEVATGAKDGTTLRLILPE